MYMLTPIVYWISTWNTEMTDVAERGKNLTPFVFVPVVNAIIGYFATSWDLVNHLVVLNSGVEPIFVNAWVLGAFTMSPVVLCIVLFIIDLILYYPFVKLQIKQNSIEAESEGVVLE